MLATLRRDRSLYGVLALLLAAVVITTVQQATSDPDQRPYLVSSSGPDGTGAFFRWLEALDYSPSAEPPELFRPPATAEAVFLLQPSQRITDDEWDTLLTWADEGGIVLIAGSNPNATALFGRLGLTITPLDTPDIWPATPLTAAPALINALPNTNAWLGFADGFADSVPLFTTAEHPVALTLPHGQGRFILSTTAYPFTNMGLREEGNEAYVLNLLGWVNPRTALWIDEWHHGRLPPAQALSGPTDWVRRTATGQALLYVAALLFFLLLLGGRYFGRPLPLPQNIQRRATVEYITAMANLQWRTGQRSAIQTHYRALLKRTLGKTYRINPTLPDAEYVAELGRMAPSVATDTLLSLLQRLNQSTATEAELLQLAQEVNDWLPSAANHQPE